MKKKTPRDINFTKPSYASVHDWKDVVFIVGDFKSSECRKLAAWLLKAADYIEHKNKAVRK